MNTITKTTDSNLFIVYKLYGNMETKIHLPKKPAAGAARIGILYRSPPLENVQNIRKGGGICRELF